jgi:hypothetical protein
MLTKLCLDQDPAKRLTAAQVSAFLELLIAGCSADDSLKLAIEIRPMPSNYISAEELKISKDYDFAGKPIFD